MPVSTWEAYNTLAMCTVCQNVTHQVKLSGDVYNINLESYFKDFSQGNDSSSSFHWNPTYSLPDGNPVTVETTLELALGSSVQWAVSYPRRVVWPLNIDPTPDSHWAKSWDNESYAGLDSPLFAMGYLDLNLTEDFQRLVVQRATECAFSPCVRTMDTLVRSGVTVSNATATDYGKIVIAESQPDGRVLTGWNAIVNGTEYFAYDAGNDDSQGRAFLLIQALRIALEGNTTYSHSGYWYADPSDGDAFDFDSTGFSQAYGGPWSSAGQQAIDGNGDFSNVVDGVGRALTGRFEQLQDSVATGTTFHSEAIIVVRWQWITFPLALVVLGLAGLTLTVISTQRHQMAVWKESTLPLLFRYTGSATNTMADSKHAHQEQNLPTGGPVPRSSPALTFSNTLPLRESNRVSSIVNQAAGEEVQLVRRDSYWVLDPTVSASDGVRSPLTSNANNNSSMDMARSPARRTANMAIFDESSSTESPTQEGYRMLDLRFDVNSPPAASAPIPPTTEVIRTRRWR
jgi:hypothetical protein